MVGFRVFDVGLLIVWLIWFFRLRDDDDDSHGEDGGGGGGPDQPGQGRPGGDGIRLPLGRWPLGRPAGHAPTAGPGAHQTPPAPAPATSPPDPATPGSAEQRQVPRLMGGCTRALAGPSTASLPGWGRAGGPNLGSACSAWRVGGSYAPVSACPPSSGAHRAATRARAHGAPRACCALHPAGPNDPPAARGAPSSAGAGLSLQNSSKRSAGLSAGGGSFSGVRGGFGARLGPGAAVRRRLPARAPVSGWGAAGLRLRRLGASSSVSGR